MFRKSCLDCNIIYYPSYIEYDHDEEDETVTRQYHNENNKYFHVTLDTIFERKFLDTVTLDLSLLSGRFVSIVEKYNILHEGRSTKPMNVKRLTLAWINYKIYNYITDATLKVPRTENLEISQEYLCKEFYPTLKKIIDNNWVYHKCDKLVDPNNINLDPIGESILYHSKIRN